VARVSDSSTPESILLARERARKVNLISKESIPLMESSNTTKLPFYRFLLIKCPVILLIKVIFFMLVDQIHLKVHLLVSKI
jgi:hypothetical protein